MFHLILSNTGHLACFTTLSCDNFWTRPFWNLTPWRQTSYYPTSSFVFYNLVRSVWCFHELGSIKNVTRWMLCLSTHLLNIDTKQHILCNLFINIQPHMHIYSILMHNNVLFNMRLNSAKQIKEWSLFCIMVCLVHWQTHCAITLYT